MSTQETCSSGSNTPWCRQYASAALLAALGIAVSVAVFLAAHSWERRSIHREFNSLAGDRFHAIDNLVVDAGRLLHFVDNPFLVGPRADSPEFPNYLRSVAEVVKADVARHSAVQALIWMPRVAKGERDAYQRAARAGFDPKFQFTDPKTSADAKAGMLQDAYFPNYLCIATTPDQAPAGRELTHDPAEWKAMEQACDTARIVASKPVCMSTDPNDNCGYHLFQALYRGDAKDVTSRRQNLVGFLRVDLDVGESISNAFKSMPPVGIDVFVSDDTDGEDVAICEHTTRLQSSAAGKNVAQGVNALESTSEADFFGRKLSVRCSATEAFWANHTVWQPWVLLFGGLVLTLTVAGYRLSLARRSIAIEQTVATRVAAFCHDAEQQRKAKIA